MKLALSDPRVRRNPAELPREVVDRARPVRSGYLTGTAITIIAVLLMLLVSQAPDPVEVMAGPRQGRPSLLNGPLAGTPEVLDMLEASHRNKDVAVGNRRTGATQRAAEDSTNCITVVANARISCQNHLVLSTADGDQWDVDSPCADLLRYRP